MRFSIVVPALNEEKNIEKCLKSLASQKYQKKEYEVLVVDGNSRDKTREISKKYGRVVVEKRKGIALARNVGARHAKGDIIIFIDADTEVSGNMLEEMDAAYSDPNLIGTTVTIIPDNRSGKFKMIIHFFNMVTRLSTYAGCAIASGICVSCRKDVFKKLEGFNEKRYSGEDIEFSFRANRRGKFKYLGNVYAVTSMRRMDKWGFMYFVYRYFHGAGWISSKKKLYERID